MLIVGIGGAVRSHSSSERALQIALSEAEAYGAETVCLAGPAIHMHFNDPADPSRTQDAINLVRHLRAADGVILASPAYHGLISGLVKNALDYVQDMASDDRPYFDGVPVGCIGLGGGSQGAVASMQALRSITHALRGWPTPFGCTVSLRAGLFDADGCGDLQVEESLRRVGRQVVDFARMRALYQVPAAVPLPLAI